MADSSFPVETDQLVIGLLAFALLALAWFFALRDLLRRDDIGGGVKVAWAIVIVALAFVGVVLYLLFRPRGATESEREGLARMSDEFVRQHTAGPVDADTTATADAAPEAGSERTATDSDVPRP